MKRNKLLIVFALLILMTGCADVVVVVECLPADPYGFWGGLWHGLVAPFSFIGSLFSDNIAMYAINNNGGWYDFGFWLGIGSLGFSSRRR